MKRIMVTGGAGFIGTHLCTRLLEDGAEVICLDNFSTGHRANVTPLASRYWAFEVLRHDVREPFDAEVDEIYHLACPASPPRYQRQPIGTMMTNVVGTGNALELARRSGAKILIASTSEVYGDPAVSPQVETYRGNVSTTGPRACYDEGKRAAEALAFDYRRVHGVSIKVPRIFNTYGPRMLENDGRVVSNFICQALRGEEITVYGTGLQTRAFCYVSDMVEALVRLMNTGDGFTGPVNLGVPEHHTVIGLAELIIRLTGSKSRIGQKPLPEDDPVLRCPDITLAEEALDWRPAVHIETGLKKTIEWFRSRGSRRLAPRDAIDSAAVIKEASA